MKDKGRFYAGVRTKASSVNYPFTQYGFNTYDDDEWKALLEENGFSWILPTKQKDTEIEVFGQKDAVDSVCWIGKIMKK